MCGTDCKEKAAAELQAVLERTDALIARIGTTPDCVIPLLQALQEEFNYLRSEALERIYERTEITRAQVVSVATFYSQFRLVPYGKHTIKVCNGTACHVKGADNVYDAFRRKLKMADGEITTADGRFSIEKIGCLGCCALAPAVQIDQKIYGHVQPGKVDEVLDAFNAMQAQQQAENDEKPARLLGEVRLGMENCCQASGTAEIYEAVSEACRDLDLPVRIKPVSCVGACNQVPMVDVALPDGRIFRYPNVRPEDVREILLNHFRAGSPLKRLRNRIFRQLDHFQTDTVWESDVWTPEEARTRTINDFFAGQERISTEGYGHMAPLDF